MEATALLAVLVPAAACGSEDLVSVRFDAPPNPCATLLVGGSIALSVALNPGPPTLEAEFLTDAGPLVGVPRPEARGMDGLVDGNPGPPTAPGSCRVGIVTASAS